MKQYKVPLILSSLAILLPLPVQLLLGREWNVAMGIPVLLLALHWLCVFFTFLDPRQEKQGKKPTLMVLGIVPALSIFLSAIDFGLSQNVDFPIFSVFCLFLGLMFGVIGNYMPKVRQNSTLGIKIYWTYTSEENWNATHRFAGRLWVAGGVLICLLAFLPERWAVVLLLGVILVMVILPLGYTYRYYRMQKARGDTLTPMTRTFLNKKAKWISLGMVAVTLVFVAVMMFTGDIAYQLEDDRFTVEADFYDDLVLVYDVIESIEYREENVEGIRTWGFASGRLLMGTFRNNEFGSYTRYTYSDAQSAVVLTTMKKIYVLSGRDPAETKALYEALLAKIG